MPTEPLATFAFLDIMTIPCACESFKLLRLIVTLGPAKRL